VWLVYLALVTTGAFFLGWWWAHRQEARSLDEARASAVEAETLARLRRYREHDERVPEVRQ
jgi:hypothetical protein